MINANYYIVEYPVGENEIETVVKGCSSTVSADKFFGAVSDCIAMDDCTDANVVDIVWHGHHVRYAGWKPGMHFVYVTPKSKKIVWEGWFPELNH